MTLDQAMKYNHLVMHYSSVTTFNRETGLNGYILPYYWIDINCYLYLITHYYRFESTGWIPQTKVHKLL